MFRKVQAPLEDCLEALRVIANSSGRERSILLADLKLKENPRDIQKVVSLCEILLYYHDKITQD